MNRPSTLCRNDTPSPVPAAIVRIARDLFVYYGYENKPDFATRDGKNPAAARYAIAEKMLKSFKEGHPPITTLATNETQYVGELVDSDEKRGWDDESTPSDYDGWS